MMTKQQVYRRVRTAIKNGALRKSFWCQRCGAADKRASDGRSTIHAHHHDYSRPLDVEWICAACHRKETPLPIPRQCAQRAEGQTTAMRSLHGARRPRYE
jgi:hypothetical protein